jgi:hypothetical protein
MLAENWQQLFFAFPSKQIVLSLEHTRLDVSWQSQCVPLQPRKPSALTFPLHNLHQLLDVLGREVADTKPLEPPSPVGFVHRSRLLFHRSDSVRHVEVVDVDFLSIELLLAGFEASSDILERVCTLFHGADFGAETSPRQVLLSQRFLAGAEIVDRISRGGVELDVAMLAEKIECYLYIITTQTVTNASGTEDDFGGLVRRHACMALFCELET